MDQGFQYLKSRLKDFSTEPGCYLMKDHQNKIFYIGKAKNLRARLKSYFTGSDTRLFIQFLEQILADIEILVVRNDTEALILERELIKQHQPRFNIMLKDDKNYILLKLKNIRSQGPLHQRYPKLEIVRKVAKDQARYFGPYPSASRLRTTVELINKYFMLRTCSDKIIDNRVRPCIQYQINRCWAPCVYDIKNYNQEIDNIILFLNNNYQAIKIRLETKMTELAQAEHFEAAAKIRDQLIAIKTSLTSQVISGPNQKRDQDIIGFARQGPRVELVIISMRGGAWQNSRNFAFLDQPFPDEEILRAFLLEAYGHGDKETASQARPAELGATEIRARESHDILLPLSLGDELASISEVLNAHRTRPLHIFSPQRGRGKKLLEIAHKNALQALKDNIERSNANEQALTALQQRLGLKLKPRRIECIDISLIQGCEPYASLVVFIDGQPDKTKYRLFSIKSVPGMNDFAMIHEAVSRRIKGAVKNGDLPDLLLVDGGKGQLSSALSAIEEANLLISREGFYIAGIAKARTLPESALHSDNLDQNHAVLHSDERLFVPGESEPIILAAHTFERYLVERIRDEAHRFALSAHRRARKARTLQSKLLDIPGIGKQRALKLLKHFGSTQKISLSTAENIAQVAQVSLSKAREILEHLGK